MSPEQRTYLDEQGAERCIRCNRTALGCDCECEECGRHVMDCTCEDGATYLDPPPAAED